VPGRAGFGPHCHQEQQEQEQQTPHLPRTRGNLVPSPYGGGMRAASSYQPANAEQGVGQLVRRDLAGCPVGRDYHHNHAERLISSRRPGTRIRGGPW